MRFLGFAFASLVIFPPVCLGSFIQVEYSVPTVSMTKPALNDVGQVAFADNNSSLGRAVFRADASNVMTIASAGVAGVPSWDISPPSINNQGQVAFLSQQVLPGGFPNSPTTNARVYVGNGSDLTLIRTSSISSFTFIGGNRLSQQSINDSGAVLYSTYDSSGFFGGPASFIYASGETTKLTVLTGGTGMIGISINEPGQIVGTSLRLTRLEPDGHFTTIFEEIPENGGASVSFNDVGHVLFEEAGTGKVYLGDGETEAQLVFDANQFSPGSIVNGMSVNDFDSYAIALDNDIYVGVGSTGAATRFLGLGDDFLGSTITAIAMGTAALNDNGSLAFGYELANGQVGVAVVSVPEGSSLGLLSCALVMSMLVRRLRPPKE